MHNHILYQSHLTVIHQGGLQSRSIDGRAQMRPWHGNAWAADWQSSAFTLPKAQPLGRLVFQPLGRLVLLTIISASLLLSGLPAHAQGGAPAIVAAGHDSTDIGMADAFERRFLDLRVWLWPNDPNVRLARANILYHLDLLDEALADYDRAIEIQPSIAAHMRRARARANHPDDAVRAGAYEDIQAVLDEEPTFFPAIDMRATMRIQDDEVDQGIAELDSLFSEYADTDALLGLRAKLMDAAGRPAEKRAMLAEIVEQNPSPELLNYLCWTRAIDNVELPEALSNCDEALEDYPQFADALDSRGVVLLRLGRVEEAIGNFNRALAVEPDKPQTLYVRGLARLWLARKDPAEKALADADLAASREQMPDIDEEYAGYGLTPEWASGR
jgi:tetratricopeptide (TPR) repeat protein